MQTSQTQDDIASGYSVYSSHCPARQFLERLADKWTILIIGRLKLGETRFNQLRRDIEGITQKVLSQTLKKLERNGLVVCRVFATVPVTVEYSLTPVGLTLVETFESLAHWAESNIESVRLAQEQYDRLHGVTSS
ncbi:MAG: winged helix-turn-helix transcriptional regulator [Symbiopectobacterium sp.]|uniref:winged helix-turn-helix transcriptional regulator n=1 Tax=Symbiopectobacterium sp. TaxID=2952789 RepID=UPI0039E854BD